MKSKVAIFSLALALMALVSCNKLKHIPFDYTYRASISVPQAVVPGMTESVSVTVPTNIDSIMEHYGSKPDLLQSAKLSALTLTISTPPGQTFAVLHEIHVYVVTSMGDVEIADKQDISSTSSTLDLDIKDVELKPYLQEQNMTLKTTFTTNTGMTQAMTIDYALKVHFEANLFKIF